MNVRRLLGVAPLIIAAIPVATLARDCNEVKAEIDAKIKAKGVTNYVLQIVNGPDVKEGQIVGNCEVGTKKIVYLQLGNSSAPKILGTEKPPKNELAELPPSDNPSARFSKSPKNRVALAVPNETTGELRSITCEKAETIVAEFGFKHIEVQPSAEENFEFRAMRDGKHFAIKIKANGELAKVQRLR